VLSLPAGSAEWPSQASAAPSYYCTCAWHTAGGQVLWCDAVCSCTVVPFHMLALEVLVQEVQSEALIDRTASSYGTFLLVGCNCSVYCLPSMGEGALLRITKAQHDIIRMFRCCSIRLGAAMCSMSSVILKRLFQHFRQSLRRLTEG
jgi:hypothetical protein